VLDALAKKGVEKPRNSFPPSEASPPELHTFQIVSCAVPHTATVREPRAVLALRSRMRDAIRPRGLRLTSRTALCVQAGSDGPKTSQPVPGG
jgi:hypothetical protein